jgi:hypothetical protein
MGESSEEAEIIKRNEVGIQYTGDDSKSIRNN